MVQVKKPEVREAILSGAFKLFSRHGYAGTSLAAIAAEAGITTSNIYRYYGSKLEVLYAVYRPWIVAHLDRLEARLKRVQSPRARLRTILLTLWRDIPEADNGFSNNLMQAISMASSAEDQGYTRNTLFELEDRFSSLIRAALPAERHHLLGRNLLVHLLFMAMDGYVLNVKFNDQSRPVTDVVDLMYSLLIGKESNS